MPIHELLNRIRWDPEFSKGTFELGYYDRAEDRIALVPFRMVSFPQDAPHTFEITDLEARVIESPFTGCARFIRIRSASGTAGKHQPTRRWTALV